MRTLTLSPILALCLCLPVQAQEDSVLAFNLNGGGFDTGVALSNAGSVAGSAIFRLFQPNDGGGVTPVEIRTQDLAQAGVGSGLDNQGRIAPGGTYLVLSSELARAAGLENYSGQIVVSAGFEGARAVNFVFNNDLGSAHGYQASPLARPKGMIFETFYGRSTCPVIEGLDGQRVLAGQTFAAVGVSGASVGGTLCIDEVEGPIGNFAVVLLRVGTSNLGGRSVDCAVCLYREP